MKRPEIYFLTLLFALSSCHPAIKESRDYICLEGEWQFALDPSSTGIRERWFLTDLKDSVYLPGTTDSNRKGFINTDTTTFHLNRVYKYEGAAWYRKKFVVPEDFMNRHIQLILERTKSATIWVDSTMAGRSQLLQSPQYYDLTGYLAPGEHYITIMVDNSLRLTPYGNVHIYSDDTQTNWNGIIGRIVLEATAMTYISDIQVFPDVERNKAEIRLNIEGDMEKKEVEIRFLAEKILNGKTEKLKSETFYVDNKKEITLSYDLGDECELWDEYRQPLYHLTAVLDNGETTDAASVTFGMRKFSVDGTQFTINGRKTFLRGKHEAAVFPSTGYTPTDVESWQRVFRIAKSYGINHYRFHSYCPPEAAFTAADMEGIYLQAELPFWGGLESDSLAEMLRHEGIAMLKAYANHPSFVMFSHGNEIWGDQSLVEKNISSFKEYDKRLLYTTGSNNGIGYIPPSECSDFFVGARTPYAHDTVLTHTRLTQAFVDSRDGGILNTQTPSTETDFSYAVANTGIPVISHEMGQYQIFPDYGEIDKYSGVLRAWNLEVFRKRLEKAGMLTMDSLFHKASGAWSAICYKAEMEAALRTPGLAGFQLLDLQDYPGQGTALVGILDAFMDSKDVIARENWLQSCNDVVLLLEYPKYCWTTDEIFKAKVVVSNYSDNIIKKPLRWIITRQNGTVLSQGWFEINTPNQGITPVGEISTDLSEVTDAEKLSVEISFPGTNYSNNYPVWIYNPAEGIDIPGDICIADKLDKETLENLEQGGKVLLFPGKEDASETSIPGLFPPEFWNYGMFKGISEWARKPVSPGTLGILTDPSHPLFRYFPTGFHTDWQWFSIIKNGSSSILDKLPEEYFPIVQVIDNLERNHKLGLIFEFRAGKGKLLVCMSDLNKIKDKPEASQLYRSILKYMESSDFNPEQNLTSEQIITILYNKYEPAQRP